MTLAKLLVAIGATTSGFQRAMSNAERRVDGLEKRAGRLRGSFGKAGDAMRKMAKIATTVLLVGLLAVTAAIGGVVNASIQYEDAFAGVRKTVDATEPELAALSKDIRMMATEIPIAATELAALGETAGALGVKTKDIKEFIRVTALLGVTTDLTAQAAADSLGVLSNVLGLTSKDYSRFGSALVALGNAGASTESQIIAIAERSGAAAKLIGLSTDEILGFASTIASIGMEPEAGGTALQTFFTKTLKFVAANGKKLEILAKAAGMTGKQFKKAFEKDAGGALLKFFRGMNKLTSAERLAVLEALGFNDARISRALLGLSDNSEELARQLGVSADAWERNSALSAEAEKRFATTKSQLGLLKNNLVEIAMTLGDALLPHFTPLIKGLNEWISANHPLIQQIGGQLAAGIKTVVGGIASWISQNGPLIQQVGTFLWQALQNVWTVITQQVVPALFGTGGKGGLIPGIVSTASKIGDFLIPKLQAFWSTLTQDVIPSIMKVANQVIPPLIGAIGGIVIALFGGGGGGHNGRVGAKRGLIPTLGTLIGLMWGDGNGPLAKAVKGIAYFFSNILGPAVGGVVDVLSTLVDLINTTIRRFGVLGDKVKKELGIDLGGLPDWLGLLNPLTALPTVLGNIDKKAAGGWTQINTPTLVGEEGPEWVDFGKRMFVHDADETAGAGGGGGDTHITIYNPEPRAADDDIGRMLRRLGGLGITATRTGWSPS